MSQKQRWTLMTSSSDYDVSAEWYSADPDDYFDYCIDHYFIVPTEIAIAYETARQSLHAIERIIRQYCDDNGHRKSFTGKLDYIISGGAEH